MLEVTATGFVDPLEVERTAARMELVDSIKVEELIVYKAKGETRAHINVFTDIDCGYCRKLHRQMDEMNAQGIEVRYLAYPRAGIRSPSFDKLATAWCSENQQEAMDKLKNREPLDMKVCDDNPVAEQFLLGGKMGVTGTPALVLADGRLVPGYMPTADLLKKLGLDPIGDKSTEVSESSQ
jgi:thiol:disulfide interchange protein DsbC